MVRAHELRYTFGSSMVLGEDQVDAVVVHVVLVGLSHPRSVPDANEIESQGDLTTAWARMREILELLAETRGIVQPVHLGLASTARTAEPRPVGSDGNDFVAVGTMAGEKLVIGIAAASRENTVANVAAATGGAEDRSHCLPRR
jgi:hypothetical protein